MVSLTAAIRYKLMMLIMSVDCRTMFAFILFGAFTLAGWGLLHRTWNKRRDALDAHDAASASTIHSTCTYLLVHYSSADVLVHCSADGIVHEKIENEEFADRTDFQIRSFRYAL